MATTELIVISTSLRHQPRVTDRETDRWIEKHRDGRTNRDADGKMKIKTESLRFRQRWTERDKKRDRH